MGTLGKPQSRDALDTILYKIKQFAEVIPCGSYRRWYGMCNDLDIAMVTDDGTMPPDIYNEMVAMGFNVLERGTKRGRFLRDSDGLQVDWYASTMETFGALILHLTGSAKFNVGMRGRAKILGYKLSENRLVKRKTGEMVACHGEEEIFKALGMHWVSPSNRTDDFINVYRRHRISQDK